MADTRFQNVKIDKKNKFITITINSKIYPLPIIYQAADIFIDKAYVFLDGDPEKNVRIIMKPKNERVNLQEFAGEFNNELLNYSAFFVRSQINKDLRDAMVKRAFLTGTGEKEDEFEEVMNQKQKIDFGTKVPLVGEERNVENKEGKDKQTEFKEKDIFVPWEKQKGAIKKEPKDLKC